MYYPQSYLTKLQEGKEGLEQSEVFRMRFDLQYSFEEIAAALKLPQGYIQKVYLQARLQLKGEEGKGPESV